MSLAENILSLRTAHGMSQDDLAEKLSVSRQSVSKWETGQSTPDLDKIIRLSDLFSVTVDELVREGALPPEPPAAREQPRVVYVRQSRERTGAQTAGIVLAVIGAVLAVVGLMSAAVLLLPALALIILSLPLILSKEHPWLMAGWTAVGLSCLVLNPYVAVCPWGLIGGLRRLYLYLTVPEIRYPATVFAIAVGVTRGTVTLLLAFLTGRLYVRAWKEQERDG